MASIQCCTSKDSNKSDPVRNYDIIPAIDLLEYKVAIYGIYIERYMNAEWKLTNDNVDVE